MKSIHHIIHAPGAHLSFEFFPPKDDSGLENIYKTIRHLNQYRPDFCSVTWGAGGSTVRKSLDVASTIEHQIGTTCVVHFTGLGMSPRIVDGFLSDLKERGISNVLVLRGDIPHHAEKSQALKGGFRYAGELVRYIRSKPENTPDRLGVLVAGCPEGHPEALSFDDDMRRLAEKVRCGAEGVITQFFFNNTAFYRFVDALKALGTEVPIAVGVMLVTKSKMIRRMLELSPNTTVPRDLSEAIARYEDDEDSMESFGIDFATRQVEDLLRNGFRHFHFYTMNRSSPTERVLLNLQDDLLKPRPNNLTG